MLGAALAAPIFLTCRGQAVAVPVHRIVSLDLLSTELLLTLGVRPLGIANRALYERLVAEPALPPGVHDLGPLTEPNAEFIAWLRPDAILLAAWQVSALDRLQAIAPLHPVQSFAGDTPALAHMIALLRQLGALTGRSAEAEIWAARAQRAVMATRAMLVSRSTRPLYICRFATNGRTVAVFGGNGLVGDVLHQVGLKNAWRGRVNRSGVVSVGIEQLATDPEASIIHFDRGEETVRAMRSLSNSSIWNALPAVRAGRVVSMPVIYPSGGVFSAIRFIEQLAQALPEQGGRDG